MKQQQSMPGGSLYISFIAILKHHLCSRCGYRVNQEVQMGQELFLLQNLGVNLIQNLNVPCVNYNQNN